MESQKLNTLTFNNNEIHNIAKISRNVEDDAASTEFQFILSIQRAVRAYIGLPKCCAEYYVSFRSYSAISALPM